MAFFDTLFSMIRDVLLSVAALLLLAGSMWYAANTDPDTATDPKNATYTIEGRQVRLVNGFAETEAAPGSTSKVVTRYFGNEIKTDLDGDGREDVAFILTQESGGSGTFYYAVAALNTGKGYIGSDGYLLGDRIAPQPTTLSTNPRQVGVVVFNYADRIPGEAMTVRPTYGRSVYLKLDTNSMRWGIVEPDFEGESAQSLPKPQTIIGYWECLPHKDQTGPQTKECALGIAVDQSDGHYAVDTSLVSTYPDFSTGTKVRVTGLVTPVEALSSIQKYDIDGIIRATGIEKI